MPLILAVAGLLQAAPIAPSTEPARPDSPPVVAFPDSTVGDFIRPFSSRWSLQDTTRRRRRTFQVSDGYYTRLQIHRIGAFAMFPLVATQFVLGQGLFHSDTRPSGLRTAHQLVAAGIGVVFATNTVTGALNWWETRRNPIGRTRRTIHSLLMLASDAGFLWTALASSGARRDEAGARHHRALAEISISVSAASALMMWIWKG